MSRLLEAVGGKAHIGGFLVSCLGLCLCLVTNGMFDSIVSNNASSSAFAVRTDINLLSGGISLIATCLVVSLFALRAKDTPRPTPILAAVLGAVQVGSLALLFAHNAGMLSDGWGDAGGLVLAAASVLLLAFWAQELAKRGPLTSLLGLAAAFMMDMLLDLLVAPLPEAAPIVLSFVSALASPAILVFVSKWEGPQLQVQGSSPDAASALDTPFWTSLVCVAIYGFTMGSVQALGSSFSEEGISGFLTTYAANIGVGVTAIAVFLFARFMGSPVVARISVLATLVAALYFSGVFGVEIGPTSMIFMTIARQTTFVYIWMMMATRPSGTRIANEKTWAIFAFCAGLGVFSLLNTLSNKIGLVVGSSGIPFVIYNIAVVLGLVGLIVLEFAAQRAFFTEAVAAAPASAATESAEDRLAQGCRKLGEAYGLTSRELEVLEPLVRGRSAATIATVLGMSTETARTHIRHIYQKTDIHNREDLMDEVEKFLEPTPT